MPFKNEIKKPIKQLKPKITQQQKEYDKKNKSFQKEQQYNTYLTLVKTTIINEINNNALSQNLEKYINQEIKRLIKRNN